MHHKYHSMSWAKFSHLYYTRRVQYLKSFDGIWKNVHVVPRRTILAFGSLGMLSHQASETKIILE